MRTTTHGYSTALDGGCPCHEASDRARVHAGYSWTFSHCHPEDYCDDGSDDGMVGEQTLFKAAKILGGDASIQNPLNMQIEIVKSG